MNKLIPALLIGAATLGNGNEKVMAATTDTSTITTKEIADTITQHVNMDDSIHYLDLINTKSDSTAQVPNPEEPQQVGLEDKISLEPFIYNKGLEKDPINQTIKVGDIVFHINIKDSVRIRISDEDMDKILKEYKDRIEYQERRNNRHTPDSIVTLYAKGQIQEELNHLQRIIKGDFKRSNGMGDDSYEYFSKTIREKMRYYTDPDKPLFNMIIISGLLALAMIVGPLTKQKYEELKTSKKFITIFNSDEYKEKLIKLASNLKKLGDYKSIKDFIDRITALEGQQEQYTEAYDRMFYLLEALEKSETLKKIRNGEIKEQNNPNLTPDEIIEISVEIMQRYQGFNEYIKSEEEHLSSAVLSKIEKEKELKAEREELRNQLPEIRQKHAEEYGISLAEGTDNTNISDMVSTEVVEVKKKISQINKELEELPNIKEMNEKDMEKKKNEINELKKLREAIEDILFN